MAEYFPRIEPVFISIATTIISSRLLLKSEPDNIVSACKNFLGNSILNAILFFVFLFVVLNHLFFFFFAVCIIGDTFGRIFLIVLFKLSSD
jgi:hypothetical protein